MRTSSIVHVPRTEWLGPEADPAWIDALEAGQVLYFPSLPFVLSPDEQALLTPAVRDPKARNISLGVEGQLKGGQGDAATLAALTAMVARFRSQAQALVHGLFPHYVPRLRLAPTSYRPMAVATRAQSWRADDKRLHVDAFPSRPTYGERILRVFTNVNPHGEPRVWRVGESFDEVVQQFLPRAKSYVPWQAQALKLLHATKSYRSEFDHLMLQLHDGMKGDLDYQANCRQETVPFPPGSTWVCFSDQATHAVMSGQFMLEQTLHFPAGAEYNPASSPLGRLEQALGRPLRGLDRR
ncbi:3-deoxy-D-manno-oct-2-ulosonic acid (Kdo) hydroxylase [Comamonas serinivorans]|uniref:3-deoxy-D-manno-oct-2-ulosonic acid (Kdo) hydroxylase n=1 Tax=Comamonas serinivorans TaxID=1082851 RepID=A0A1Y0ETF6_9BURK|nr:Kdo hydroxylase family protein [Comamonas serinivorans]ARU06883.1 3-deoxy-D-manno-oct-2-ulosonic acid (Kdo) hydroxylase [Comamonas serinivorans]